MEKVTFYLSSKFKDRADKLFEEQKEKIKQLLPEADIQHIGGTTIPNLYTKGDLDINIRVSNKEEFNKAIEVLKTLFEINQFQNWKSIFASFKDDTSFELPLGVQLTVINSPGDHFVIQREALKNNPELVKSFNALRLQYQNKEMEEYRKAKEQFLKDNNLA